jgi:hypothetical protein
MRRLTTAGLAAFGMLWGLAGCADPASEATPPAGGQAATATIGAARSGAEAKRRDRHLSGRHLNQAVYYPRTFRGRRHLAPEWHPVPYTRAVAAVGELLGPSPTAPGRAGPSRPADACTGSTSTPERPPSSCPGRRCRPPGRPGAGRSRPWSTPFLLRQRRSALTGGPERS